MSDKRKPEWTPPGAGAEFASRVLPAAATGQSERTAPWREHKRREPDIDALETGVIAGDRTMLSRAITLIESNSAKHFEPGQELIRRLLPVSGNSIRIGITGVPGAGKSTFIESFGMLLLDKGHKVAVLAVDPSSSLSKGSILGDKTRMENLSRALGSFIRPSPSSGVLGGVARKTRETIILCEAAGFDTILIETVGVGQSEITVRSMVDFFLLMQIAGAGDELQGIKKGIMELADLVVVNKADGDNIHAAELAKGELNHALHYLRPSTQGWKTRAVLCSSLQGSGLDDILGEITRFVEHTRTEGVFQARRDLQTSQWFESLLSEALLNKFFAKQDVKAKLELLRKDVNTGSVPVVLAVKQITDLIDN